METLNPNKFDALNMGPDPGPFPSPPVSYYQNLDWKEQLNRRHFNRNVPLPSQNPGENGLRPQFSYRPVSTKYTLMPGMDSQSRRQTEGQSADKIGTWTAGSISAPAPAFSPYTTFNPGNAQRGPWTGYASNINVETRLRNQCGPLQRHDVLDEHGWKWVPASQSTLYKNPHIVGRRENDQHIWLHRNYSTNLPRHDPRPRGHPGDIRWNNDTRQQTKNIRPTPLVDVAET